MRGARRAEVAGDGALAGAPEACDDAHQRGLAAPAGAHDEQRLPRAELEVQAAEERPLVGRLHGEALDSEERGCLCGAAPDATSGWLCFKDVEELVQALNRGVEVCQPLELADDEGGIAGDMVEDLCALVDKSKVDATSEVVRNSDQIGDEPRKVRVRLCEVAQVPADNLRDRRVLHHRVQPPKQEVPLALLALVEGNGLGVLAQTHEGKAEVGLVLLLHAVQRDQPPPQPQGDARASRRHRHQGDEHRGVHLQQDRREDAEVQCGPQDHLRRGQRLCGAAADVVVDPLVRVVQLPLGLNLVVLPALEVPVKKLGRHPLAPLDRELGLEVLLEDEARDAPGHIQKVEAQRAIKAPPALVSNSLQEDAVDHGPVQHCNRVSEGQADDCQRAQERLSTCRGVQPVWR
mmetsp:Transcript_18223/g.57197  ORF Transcript_18223/g.57197 Transcript_18223/m.57197 type:complete len:405 (+) Transcript_18223:306-1520(+)